MVTRSRATTAAAAAAAALAKARAEGPCPIQVPEGAFASNAAWDVTVNNQPHHVMAPFAAELSPPVEIPGLCADFSPRHFAPEPAAHGEWVARATNATGLSLAVDGALCSQVLDGISVFGAERPALRLHFDGCERPASVLEVRVFDDSKAGEDFLLAEGTGLLDFVCKVAPEPCREARSAALLPEGDETVEALAARVGVMEGKVGHGRCDGDGVIPEDFASATSDSACEETCNHRVQANFADPSKQSCRGYAWSETGRSCRLYSGWPITRTDHDDGRGYVCYKVRDGWKTPAAAELQARREALAMELPGSGAQHGGGANSSRSRGELRIAQLFADPRAVTARRMQVKAFPAGCFAAFDWFILDRALRVPPRELAVLRQLSRDAPAVSSVGGAKPRTDIVIERVCVRDCAGQLRAECLEPKVEIFMEGASEAPSCSSTLCTLVGEEMAEAAADPNFWPWALALGLLALLLGFGLTNCLALVWCQRNKPRYQTVEAVKLVYEGEGEDEVVLQQGQSGMMSVSGKGGALASWQPSRSTRGGARTAGLTASRAHGRNVNVNASYQGSPVRVVPSSQARAPWSTT